MQWCIGKWTPILLSNYHEGHFLERLHTDEAYSQSISEAKQTSGCKESDTVSNTERADFCEVYVDWL